MRKLLLMVAALATLVFTENRGQADFIIGAQAFGSSSTTSSPDVNDVNDTLFTFDFVTLIGGANQTDDYVGTFGSFINVLDTTAPLGFVFGSPLYGTFAPSVVLENSLISNVSRTVQLSGTFTPGILTFGPILTDPTPGILTITINESTIGGSSSLSGSATLATAPNVPEPATIVMLATACGPIGLFLLRNRRSRKKTT